MRLGNRARRMIALGLVLSALVEAPKSCGNPEKAPAIGEGGVNERYPDDGVAEYNDNEKISVTFSVAWNTDKYVKITWTTGVDAGHAHKGRGKTSPWKHTVFVSRGTVVQLTANSIERTGHVLDCTITIDGTLAADDGGTNRTRCAASVVVD